MDPCASALEDEIAKLEADKRLMDDLDKIGYDQAVSLYRTLKTKAGSPPSSPTGSLQAAPTTTREVRATSFDRYLNIDSVFQFNLVDAIIVQP